MKVMSISELKQRYPEEMARIEDADLRTNMMVQTLLTGIQERDAQISELKTKLADVQVKNLELIHNATHSSKRAKTGVKKAAPTKPRGRPKKPRVVVNHGVVVIPSAEQVAAEPQSAPVN